jgi:chromosome segregation ATPase
VDYLEEENVAKNRIEEEEAQRYGLKLAALQAKLREIEETREKLIRRNQDLLYEIEKTESSSVKENAGLEEEIGELKVKEEEFTARNKEFLTRNEKLKGEIQLKEITIEKLEEELNRLNEEIDLKKKYNKDQVDKIIIDNTDIRRQKEQEKRAQIEKYPPFYHRLNEL